MASQTARKFQLCFRRYFFFLFSSLRVSFLTLSACLSRPFLATSPLRVSARFPSHPLSLQLSPDATLSTPARADSSLCYLFALLCQARAEKSHPWKQRGNKKAVEKGIERIRLPIISLRLEWTSNLTVRRWNLFLIFEKVVQRCRKFSFLAFF